MKRYAFAVCALAALGIYAVTVIETRPREHRALSDDVVARASSWKHLCPTVDGGTADDIMKDVDGGARNEVTDWTVENDSTTCVRIGYDGRVDGTHGFRVGVGCPAGSTWPSHARVGRCRSEGAAQLVDVGGGQP